MHLDPWALARMTWLSVLTGVGLSLFLEALRFLWCLFGADCGRCDMSCSDDKSKISSDVSRTSAVTRSEKVCAQQKISCTVNGGRRNTAGGEAVALFFRDILFFTVSGVVFAVFVYCTNNGRLRFAAVAGLLTGFFISYATLGRLVRRVSGAICRFIRAFIRMLLRPAVWVIRGAVRLAHHCKQKMSAAKPGGTERSNKSVGSSNDICRSGHGGWSYKVRRRRNSKSKTGKHEGCSAQAQAH